MGFHNILSKAQRAVVAYLISAGAGTDADIFPAKHAETVDFLPFTAVAATDWSPAVEGSNRATFIVKVTVEIHTNCSQARGEDAETMRSDSDDRVQNTFDALSFADTNSQDGYVLGELITEAARSAGGSTDLAQFTCISAKMTGGDQGHSEKESEWLDSVDLELLCVPSNVS